MRLLWRLMRGLLWIAVVAAIAIVALRLIFPVPSTDGRAADNAPPPADTTLFRHFAAQGSEHPGKSGIVELAIGADALSSRLLLIDQAEHTIDAQYYIWQDDTSGWIMFKAILAAADRGVKVRLLLDDNGVPGFDGIMAALDAHPNISVRLFNPSTVRSPKLAGYAFDFFRMNRRMHNKALIVDGAASVIGGRNIGDIYFDVGDDAFYIDLDALAVGTVVADVSSQFDLYWNSRSAIEADRVLSPSPDDAAAIIASPRETVSQKAQTDALARATQFRQSLGQQPPFEWVDVKVIYDDPSKGLGEATTEQLLISKFAGVAGSPKQHAELASAYFVPGKDGTAYFAGLARSGVKVRILTNAASANDVLLVHTGYLKYRQPLLESGVELFEMKRVGPARDRAIDIDLDDLAGSSGSSLHAKTFSLDGERIFIGSFNFDPRSVILNCEMGMMIESPRLAQRMAHAFDTQLALGAYRPHMRDGRLVWLETGPAGEEIVHETEPGMSLTQRVVLRAISYLPIEWLL